MGRQRGRVASWGPAGAWRGQGVRGGDAHSAGCGRFGLAEGALGPTQGPQSSDPSPDCPGPSVGVKPHRLAWHGGCGPRAPHPALSSLSSELPATGTGLPANCQPVN